MPKINANSWHRFLTTYLSVSADIMGNTHSFNFENHEVSVRLPEIEDANRDEKKYDHVARLSSSVAKTGKPLTFSIEKVDLEIEIPVQLSVPNEALVKPPSQFDAFNDEQRSVVDKVCKEHAVLAEKAFDYWLDIIRWSSGYGLIGQPYLTSKHSGWGTYIFDSSSNHRVWACDQVFVVKRDLEVTAKHWDKAEERLSLGLELPMHYRFLHDAESSIENQLFEKAIIELAMACEIYLRYSVFSEIPSELKPELVTYIEEANINQYVSKFFKSLVHEQSEKEYKHITKDISSLISRRNSYVHMGTIDDASKVRCNRYKKSIQNLFLLKLKNE